MSGVKQPDGRAERSRRTRAKIIAAATELFVAKGYGATSLREVADLAGVAVQTIYFVFHNKRTLFKEMVDATIAGDDEPVATMDRPWFREACTSPTAAEQLRAHVHGTAAILERVAPLTKAIDTAGASDPEIATLWNYQENPRYTVHAAAAQVLVSKPDARPGVSAEHAADLLYGLLSPELYLVFVRDRGWSSARWEDWARATLQAQLCADGAGPAG
ncbi:AcrR family transcriptional regulator [Saccharomonospora amisosensis]|uniref:AcrR family transcriptional regulator n=1 Tax=Saccharomonospora amisosensis TaxID=1128677 RepID=A0A7X5UPP7_9PSEU|nr:TetR/AcrR family transcriptional regulator [Saccharomonospora amisosensis]NIJ11929.1 AcrR family transcriptional regulator [Saccharomonospora amisosensis]